MQHHSNVCVIWVLLNLHGQHEGVFPVSLSKHVCLREPVTIIYKVLPIKGEHINILITKTNEKEKMRDFLLSYINLLVFMI